MKATEDQYETMLMAVDEERSELARVREGAIREFKENGFAPSQFQELEDASQTLTRMFDVTRVALIESCEDGGELVLSDVELLTIFTALRMVAKRRTEQGQDDPQYAQMLAALAVGMKDRLDELPVEV